MKEKLFRFLYSNHRGVYICLAWKYLTSPSRVYALAHGRPTLSVNDEMLIDELKVQHIIPE